MKTTWLAEVLRGAGLQVVELPDWKNRGAEMSAIYGVVAHHTATSPSASDESVAELLRKGRPDLPGPLSQLGLDRHGRFWIIAAGRSNHNGYGTWGNNSIGIEAFNNGIGEPWATVQLIAWYKGVAAILKRLSLGVDRVKGHKETDPGRKIDPRGIDMNDFRNQVNSIMHAASAPPVTINPPIVVGSLEEKQMRVTVEVPTDANGNGWADYPYMAWVNYRGVSAQGFDPPFVGGYKNPTVTAHQINAYTRVVVTDWIPNSKCTVHLNMATT